MAVRVPPPTVQHGSRLAGTALQPPSTLRISQSIHTQAMNQQHQMVQAPLTASWNLEQGWESVAVADPAHLVHSSGKLRPAQCTLDPTTRTSVTKPHKAGHLKTQQTLPTPYMQNPRPRSSAPVAAGPATNVRTKPVLPQQRAAATRMAPPMSALLGGGRTRAAGQKSPAPTAPSYPPSAGPLPVSPPRAVMEPVSPPRSAAYDRRVDSPATQLPIPLSRTFSQHSQFDVPSPRSISSPPASPPRVHREAADLPSSPIPQPTVLPEIHPPVRPMPPVVDSQPASRRASHSSDFVDDADAAAAVQAQLQAAFDRINQALHRTRSVTTAGAPTNLQPAARKPSLNAEGIPAGRTPSLTIAPVVQAAAPAPAPAPAPAASTATSTSQLDSSLVALTRKLTMPKPTVAIKTLSRETVKDVKAGRAMFLRYQAIQELACRDTGKSMDELIAWLSDEIIDDLLNDCAAETQDALGSLADAIVQSV